MMSVRSCGSPSCGYCHPKPASQERLGDWIEVKFGGDDERRFWPIDPRAEEVDIREIARRLSKLCRFGGGCDTFYSVAQHSVLVSRICGPQDALWGLLHDASEAYIGDVVKPLKTEEMMKFYRAVESGLQFSICQWVGITPAEPAAVKVADRIALATEARGLVGEHTLQSWRWFKDVEPLPQPIDPWPWQAAEVIFLDRFRELTNA